MKSRGLASALALALVAPSAFAAERVVRLRTADGVTIAGTFAEPSQLPAPAVLLLHMLSRSRGDWTGFARRLADAGFCTLAIDLRGHGDSTTRVVSGAPQEFSFREFDPGGDEYRKMVLDAAAAREFLRAQPGVNQARLAYVGASIGANAAAVAAAADSEVRALVLLSAGIDYRRLRADDALTKYGGRPALLVASREDTYATRSAEKLVTLGQGVRELKLLEGAGHGTLMLARDPALEGAVVDWLKRTVYY